MAAEAIASGLNCCIHDDSLKLVANDVHTRADLREANPQFGDERFDEVVMRLQLLS